MSDIEQPATTYPGLPAIEVLTFSGGPTEDVTVFLQNVKRIAFAQGRQKDDVWLVEYVETCLVGAALRWFSELEDAEGVQSWRALRKACLERFGPPVNTQAPPAAAAAVPVAGPANAPTLHGLRPLTQAHSSVPHPSSILRSPPGSTIEVMKV